jgi:hypothetical protein
MQTFGMIKKREPNTCFSLSAACLNTRPTLEGPAEGKPCSIRHNKIETKCNYLIMKHKYKLLAKYLLMFPVLTLMLSCSKEEASPKLDTTLLMGKQWQLTKVAYREKEKDFAYTPVACQEDDFIEFKADKQFIRNNGQLICDVESQIQVNKWSIVQESKILIFEKVEYEIIELTSTSLHLYQELQSIEGTVPTHY